MIAFLMPQEPILVPGHKYPKMKGDHLYGGTDTHGCFAIYFFNPCFRVQGAVGKSVGLLAANPILNSAKSSTDFPTTPCTYGLGQVDTGDGEIQRIIP